MNEPSSLVKPVHLQFDANWFWEQRYAMGGNSGVGSQGDYYRFKRDFINFVIKKLSIQSIIDFGCGDGQQILELEIANYYGMDISQTAVQGCRQKYKDRPGYRFDTIPDAKIEQYDMAMSLDVLYHVVNPEEYKAYLHRFFSCSTYALLYTNLNPLDGDSPHVVYRDHLREIANLQIKTKLLETVQNPIHPLVGFFLFQNG